MPTETSQTPIEDVPLIAQRIRNRIIEVLELLRLEGTRCEDRETDSKPLANDLTERWVDWVNDRTLDLIKGPVFSAEEVVAINALNNAARANQGAFPASAGHFSLVRDCLAVFERRGRFPEEQSLEKWPPDPIALDETSSASLSLPEADHRSSAS